MKEFENSGEYDRAQNGFSTTVIESETRETIAIVFGKTKDECGETADLIAKLLCNFAPSAA